MDVPPAVRYVTTADGWSIAYTTRGSGPPLVCLPFGFSHAQHVWQGSSATPLLASLSKNFQVVYYDSRGQGLSQRGLAPTTTMDSFLLDLEAVIGALRVQRPVLFAHWLWTFVAARYAYANPDRVAALALMHSTDLMPEFAAGLRSLAASNWDYFLSSQAGMAVPRDAGEAQRIANRLQELKARVTQQDLVRILDVFAASEDMPNVLRRLRVPALVLHPPNQQLVSQEATARAAAMIPNGRLVVLDTDDFFGGEEAAAAIESFLAEVEAAGPNDGRDSTGQHQLSSREMEVLKLIAAGKSNREIAADLVISLNTVTRHISHIFAKTGAANRAEAAAYATRRGLV